ncbi:MAG TPA: LysR substrate-binding domain-containing protein [Xanthobacteraceae bacterium]|nr:LysR substrate-binding domain-containing protein [Xanthobacteraceae bacterium]
MQRLDLDLLATFVAIADCGGFAHAAKRVHRSQSAISLQMQRLESMAGAALFKRAGRRMQITDAGDVLLNRARKLLALNDETLHALRGTAVDGSVRLGAPTDVAEDLLPDILREFRAAHAAVGLEVVVDRSNDLVRAFRAGSLDLAIALGETTDAHVLGMQKVVWIAARDFKLDPGQPVPLILLDAPCMFRELAINALDERRVPWRIVYSTSSLSGLRAAVKAGFGITPRTISLPERGLRFIPSHRRLPALGGIALSLYGMKNPRSLAVAKLAELVEERLGAALGMSPRPRGRRGP